MSKKRLRGPEDVTHDTRQAPTQAQPADAWPPAHPTQATPSCVSPHPMCKSHTERASSTGGGWRNVSPCGPHFPRCPRRGDVHSGQWGAARREVAGSARPPLRRPQQRETHQPGDLSSGSRPAGRFQQWKEASSQDGEQEKALRGLGEGQGAGRLPRPSAPTVRRRPSSKAQARNPQGQGSGRAPLYLSVTSRRPRSTGFEVAIGAGAGRGVKAAVAQSQRHLCSSPLSAPRGHGRPGLPWGPCWLRASKQRQHRP